MRAAGLLCSLAVSLAVSTAASATASAAPVDLDVSAAKKAQPSEAEVVQDLSGKLDLLRDAYDGGALRLDSYLSAAGMSIQEAADRRHGVARAARRMQAAAVPTGMSGKHVKVVTMIDEPFVMPASKPGETLRYTGFCVDMLDQIAELGNFTYEWVDRTPANQKKGWDGAVYDVAAGNADMFWSSFFLGISGGLRLLR